MPSKMPCTDGPGRNDGCDTLRNFLILDNSQTAIDFLFLSIYSSRCRKEGRNGEETAAGAIACRGILFILVPSEAELQGVVGAGVDTIHACHTAAVVYFVLFRIDARSLAVTGAEAAVHTLGGVDSRCK